MSRSKYAYTIPDDVVPLQIPEPPVTHPQKNAPVLDALMMRLIEILGPPTYRGNYGGVWSVKMTPTLEKYLKKLFDNGVDKVELTWPRVGAKLAIKLQEFVDPDDDFSYVAHQWRRETEAHAHLSRLSVVPKLYLACRIGRFYITVMEHVFGSTVHSVTITPQLHTQIERAVRQVWEAGYAHGDLHGFNMLITPLGRVTIIDFGSAVELPEEIRERVRESRHMDADKVWNTYIRPYVDAYKKGDGYTWYNPNGAALSYMHERKIDYLADLARQELRSRRA